MDEQSKVKKNHWTSANIDNATKKINQEIYGRKRQAPLQIKMDDLAIFINDKITRRGIVKGMVFVQEDLNKNMIAPPNLWYYQKLNNNSLHKARLLSSRWA